MEKVPQTPNEPTVMSPLVLSLAGTSCANLDEDIFDDELMTAFVDNVRRCR